MRVLLTQPLVTHIEKPPNITDLGLGYIAEHLIGKGFETYIKDWNMRTTEEAFKKWLVDNQIDVVGIKVFTKDVAAALQTVSIVKSTLPDSVVVMGGPHPSCADPDELMHSFPLVDYAFRGEAELAFPKLLDTLGQKLSSETCQGNGKHMLEGIPGLVWREGGRVKSNPVQFVTDLDRLKRPAWEIMDPNSYGFDLMTQTEKEGVAAPIITTRGCPGKCSFCSAYLVNGRKIRSRSPQHVIQEIRFLYETYSVEKFSFMDNCFTAGKSHLREICESIISENLDIRWDCNCYEVLDNLDEEMISLMYRSGCRMVHMGIESASNRIRKQMNKFSALTDYSDKINELKKSGIAVGTWFMIGFPDETFAEMKETINYAFSRNADLLTFTICFPLPGSQLYSFLKRKHKVRTVDWAGFDVEKSQYPLSRVSSSRLKLILKWIRLRIRIRDRIRKVKSNAGRPVPAAAAAGGGGSYGKK